MVAKKNHAQLAKALAVVTARNRSHEEGEAAETAFVQEVLADQELIDIDHELRQTAHPRHRDKSGLAATEEFGLELQCALELLAELDGETFPNTQKYNPLFAKPLALKGLWKSRQIADQLGIAYGFYVNRALDQREEKGLKRVPLPSQLHSPDVAMYVMMRWQERGIQDAYK